ncbi:hypothetical protein GQX74_005266 [Glossina fuscipes]|nr:hypothetical protein GQX74_005266 [Glossina fuscipes]
MCRTLKYCSVQWLGKCHFSASSRYPEEKQLPALGEICGESMLKFCPPKYWPAVSNVFHGSDKSHTADDQFLDCFLNYGMPYLTKDASEDNCQQPEQLICCPSNIPKWKEKKPNRISDACYLKTNNKYLWCRKFIKPPAGNMCEKEVCPKPSYSEYSRTIPKSKEFPRRRFPYIPSECDAWKHMEIKDRFKQLPQFASSL